LCAGRKKRLEKRLAAGPPATFAVPLTMSFAAGLRYWPSPDGRSLVAL
jgi:hypothetical protein